ncbi:MAG: VCBS repeat-containing protein, partial [Pirellulales bacterium]|nr:VCBS repeat-containing protein [Pirellulales bacterium]
MIASIPCPAGRLSESRVSWRRAVIGVPMLWLLVFGVSRAADRPRFREHVVTAALKQGYQLVSADLNNDGKKDLIAVDEAGTELAWFENPTWKRHVLAVDVPRPLNVDCWDIDGDGIPEIVLAYRFDSRPEKSVGNLALLKSGPDVRAAWTIREIDRVPTAHRVRWIDPEGNGKKVLLVGPLVGERFPPQEGDRVPIYLYRP